MANTSATISQSSLEDADPSICTNPSLESHLRIAVIGNVDSGKSSVTGVMITGKLDNGNGSARKTVLKLPHEKATGRSSTVSYNYLIQNIPDNATSSSSSQPSTRRRVVTLVDLCGHIMYLRTTIYGITAHRVD
jgi:GTPase